MLLVATVDRPNARLFAEPPAEDDVYVVNFDGVLPPVCQGGLARLQSSECAAAMEDLAPDPIVISDEIIDRIDCSDENIFVDEAGVLPELDAGQFSSQAINGANGAQAFIKKCCEKGTKWVCKTKYRWECRVIAGFRLCGFWPYEVCKKKEVCIRSVWPWQSCD